MQIPYKSFSIHPSNKLFPTQKELLRPVVTLDFINKKGEAFSYDVLIDSGADYCLFHAMIAKQLGLDIKKGKALGFYGTSGRAQTAYFHQITFSLKGNEITSWVGFSTGIESMSVGLLGQYGFFDKFKISFDYKNSIMEVN